MSCPRIAVRFLLFAAAALFTIAGCARPAHPASAESPEATIPYDREKAIASFEVVWQTVRDKHWDPTLGGLDWQQVHDELRPRIESATSMADARHIMDDMLARLKQSHFGIWPQEVYLRDEGDTASGDEASATPVADTAPAGAPKQKRDILARSGSADGVSGLEIRIWHDQALVTRVAPGSSAAAAGVVPGWVLLDADGQNIQQLSNRLKKEKLRRISNDESLLAIMTQHLVTGESGDTIVAHFLDAHDQNVTKNIVLARNQGVPARLGNLPTFYLDIDSRRIDGNIQYFRFNVFLDPVRLMGAFADAVRKASDADGFIIDLRGNPGGIGGLAVGMGGWFVEDEDIKLGTMYTRDGTLNFVLNPRLGAYTGPLAILVDGLSGSTSEIFAGGMKDIGRARVFGQRSAGAALPSIIDVLPDGDRFQYAIANYISAGGQPLEGHGVEPDETIELDRQALVAGRDPAIDAAARWIHSHPITHVAAPATAGAPAGTH